MKPKICPLFMAGMLADPRTGWGVEKSSLAKCLQNQCEWWISSVYSTEALPQDGRCAIRFAGEKNSEGLLVV